MARSLAFRPSQDRGGVRVQWLGPSSWTAGQLLAASRSGDCSALPEAIWVLYSILGEGPVPAHTAKALAQQAGIPAGNLRRANAVMKKLTLSADPDVIEEARELAEQSGTSVSSMFERFIRLLAVQRRKARSLGPITRKASGMIALPKGRSERPVLEDAIQYVSALRVEAACLISRNPDHFPRSVLSVVTPAEFIVAHSFEKN